MGEALSGVTTRVEVLFKGVPVVADDEINSFTNNVTMDTRTRNPLGRASSIKNQIVRGYAGSIGFDITSVLGLNFVRDYVNEVKAGIKPDVSIVEVSTFVDTGLQTTRQWLIVTIEGMERSFSGTANVSGSWTWSAEEQIG